MHVDLDILPTQPQSFLFTVKIDGSSYSLRQPSVEEEQLLRDHHLIRDWSAMIWSLFNEPRPPKSSLTSGPIYSLVLYLVGYLAVRRMVPSQIATQFASSFTGTPKPPPSGHAIQPRAPLIVGQLPN